MAKRTKTAQRRPGSRQGIVAPHKPLRPEPASLEVVHYPAVILAQRAENVVEIDAWLRAVAARMVELMVANKGVGLAAPQVGLPLRMFVYSVEGKPEEARVLLNPEVEPSASLVEGEEGCLSLPDIRLPIMRATGVQVSGFDLTGTEVSEWLEEWPARIIQHEADHLEGIMIIDRISDADRLRVREQLRSLETASTKRKK